MTAGRVCSRVRLFTVGILAEDEILEMCFLFIAKAMPQGLKPPSFVGPGGTTEGRALPEPVVDFPL